MQNGFSALQWTKKDGAVNSVQRKAGQYPGFFSDPWTDDPWEGSIMYRCDFQTTPHWALTRLRGKAAISGIPIIIPHTAHVYFHPTPYVYQPWLPFFDLDIYGMVEDEYWLFQDIASSSDASHISNFLGDIDTAPAGGPSDRDTIDCSIAGWILKWDFTNQG